MLWVHWSPQKTHQKRRFLAPGSSARASVWTPWRMSETMGGPMGLSPGEDLKETLLWGVCRRLGYNRWLIFSFWQCCCPCLKSLNSTRPDAPLGWLDLEGGLQLAGHRSSHWHSLTNWPNQLDPNWSAFDSQKSTCHEFSSLITYLKWSECTRPLLSESMATMWTRWM